MVYQETYSVPYMLHARPIAIPGKCYQVPALQTLIYKVPPHHTTDKVLRVE